jgi:hypothetical protein
LAARDLSRWEEALAYNARLLDSMRTRGASGHDLAASRFNDYGPLLELGRWEQADRLLADCQQTFTDTTDIPMLGRVFGARAHLAAARGRHADAARLDQTGLRLAYTQPDPADVAVSHHNLGVRRARAGDPAGACAHHLAAATLRRLVGNTEAATRSLRAAAADLATTPDLTPPADLATLAAAVEQTDGVRFTDLLDALCPDREAAEQTVHDLATAAASAATAADAAPTPADTAPTSADDAAPSPADTAAPTRRR